MSGRITELLVLKSSLLSRSTIKDQGMVGFQLDIFFMPAICFCRLIKIEKKESI